jgi:hypothetical protein
MNAGETAELRNPPTPNPSPTGGEGRTGFLRDYFPRPGVGEGSGGEGERADGASGESSQQSFIARSRGMTTERW